jgi:hypothetical protein
MPQLAGKMSVKHLLSIRSVWLIAATAWVATPAFAQSPFFFSTGNPDGLVATLAKPSVNGQIETETGDDFVTTQPVVITGATFTGLLPTGTPLSAITDVDVEFYHVFPIDSVNPPDGKVPTRVNSPSDNAFDERDSAVPGQLTFTATVLNSKFTAANSVVTGIHPIPNQTTGGEGPVTGEEVQFNVTFTTPFSVGVDHIFFRPQVALTSGNFLWLSAPKPIVAPGTPFSADLQTWIRNDPGIAPDWLRIGTDIIGGTGQFNATFSLTGTTQNSNAANLSLVAAVLPLSRSVEVGATATAFATMINVGPAAAADCTIVPAANIPANFVFQTTNPATNALTGSPEAPVNIAPGQAQSFVIALTPTVAFAPTNVAFTFTCGNAPSPAATTVGIDTLSLSASTSPVPDIVALAASADPGFVDIPGATGNGAFAVATVNLGSASQIIVGANTGAANLPVQLFLCQTNPTSGACLAPPAATVTTNIAANATPTFGAFVAGSAPVADMPGVNRVFVTFTDSSGTLRGETSVAVRTQ